MPPPRRKPPGQRAMIVDAWLHPDDLEPFHRLRRRFFPGHRLFTSAHLTLFHYIRPDIRQDFIDFARQLLPELELERSRLAKPVTQNGVTATHAVHLNVKRPFALGKKGVAYALEDGPLKALRQPLRDRFADHLKAQDARNWGRPHITVQNKVEADEAGRVLRHLGRLYEPCSVRLLGIGCYRYDYGPWTYLDRVALGGH